MRTSAKSAIAVQDSYLRLIRRCPLRAIRTREQYEDAGKMIDLLSVRDALDDGEQQYLDAIEVLVSAYEDAKEPVESDRREPVDRLKSLLKSSGTSAPALQRLLGASQSMVSMMLSGERAMSKKTILKLAAHFNLDPGYFL